MDDFLKQVYLGQVKEQCEYCFGTLKRLNLIMKKRFEGDFFHEALDFVEHAAAVSRFFWPPTCREKGKDRRSQVRGHALRESLGIQDDHPLRDRTLRNHFAHFDERLDEWAENSRNRVIIGKLIGPRKGVSGVADTDIIHHYDPATGIYAFRGEPFNIQSLADGVVDVYDRTKLQLEKRL